MSAARGGPAADDVPAESAEHGDDAEQWRTDEGEDHGGGFSLLHVPIKRKGSRKR